MSSASRSRRRSSGCSPCGRTSTEPGEWIGGLTSIADRTGSTRRGRDDLREPLRPDAQPDRDPGGRSAALAAHEVRELAAPRQRPPPVSRRSADGRTRLTQTFKTIGVIPAHQLPAVRAAAPTRAASGVSSGSSPRSSNGRRPPRPREPDHAAGRRAGASPWPPCTPCVVRRREALARAPWAAVRSAPTRIGCTGHAKGPGNGSGTAVRWVRFVAARTRCTTRDT